MTDSPITDRDYRIIKYSPGGAKKWTKSYSGPTKGWDNPSRVAVDIDNNVYITGDSTNKKTGYDDIVTIKYTSSGRKQWLRKYGEPGKFEHGRDMAVRGKFIYITGDSIKAPKSQALTLNRKAV